MPHLRSPQIPGFRCNFSFQGPNIFPPQVPCQPAKWACRAATFQIVLKPQSHLPPTFPRSPSDRFLLKTAVAPDLNIDSPESTQSEVVNRWFNSGPHRPTHDVKLKVCFVGPLLLTHAVGAGDIEAVKGIFKRQRSVVSEISHLEAESLYRVANQLGDHSLIDLLLDAGLKVDSRKGLDDDVRCASSKGWSELPVAAAFDRTEELRSLAKGRAEVDCRDKEARTPLHLAASKGQLSSAKVLVTAGANVDARSKDGRMALYRAAANGDRRMVEMLFEVGADPNIGYVDHFRSAIDIARDKDHIEVAKILERGEAVLHAARRGELELLESLLDKGATTNFSDTA